MYLRNGRSSKKHSSWFWSCKHNKQKLIKLSRDPIDNLDWTMHGLNKLLDHFDHLLAYMNNVKAPNFSKQEELR